MPLTELLKQEHTDIKRMLEVLRQACLLLESDKLTDLAHLDRIIDFIRSYADAVHHGKEEELLFVVMEKAGYSPEEEPLGNLYTEHMLGREFVNSMDMALDDLHDGETDAVEDFVDMARGYIDLLTSHICCEENLLFPMADEHLSVEQKQWLSQESKKFSAQSQTKTKTEESLQILNDLEQIYCQAPSGLNLLE